MDSSTILRLGTMLLYFVDTRDLPDLNIAEEWEVNFYKSRRRPCGPPLFYLFSLHFCSLFLHSTFKWKKKVKSIIRNKQNLKIDSRTGR